MGATRLTASPLAVPDRNDPAPRPVSPDRSDLPAGFAERLRALRSRVGKANPLVLLHVGDDETVVIVDKNPETSALRIPIGVRKTAAEHFRTAWPAFQEMENAIMTVEDALAPARPFIPARISLYSMDGLLRRIADAAGVSGSPTIQLSREAVENTFNRLASVLGGRPAASEGLPGDTDFAVALLILREFLHHMDFDAIVIAA